MDATQEAMDSLDAEERENDRDDDEERYDDGATFISEEEKKKFSWEEGARKEIRHRKIIQKQIKEMEEELFSRKASEEERVGVYSFHFPEQEKWIQEHFDD